MKKSTEKKVKLTLSKIRDIWPKLQERIPFIAFSTGKDSLALTAMLYEAIAPERPPCIYVHHDMEFPENLEYLERLQNYGFKIEVITPFLNYFELMDRGIGFLTRQDAWCVPMLVGTGLLDWLLRKGAKSPRDGAMYRGISGSEYSHKFHMELEIYKKLELPCINPLLGYTKDEIIEIIQDRYGLPLNPIYDHMERTYCICCYTSANAGRKAYSEKRFPEICKRYYQQIEEMLFDSGLIEKSHLDEKHKTREEKLDRHGFIYWRRSKTQEVVGAVKYRIGTELVVYQVREQPWINTKHLKPVHGHWRQKGKEIRFYGIAEQISDLIIKRMINCLDCGFCVVQCFSTRSFDRERKVLKIDNCIQCGNCLNLKHCMGWKHRFWRRVIREV
ncbi:phosphoadenosine phosphosulfate reductase family protein [Planctomycetota bacterium]